MTGSRVEDMKKLEDTVVKVGRVMFKHGATDEQLDAFITLACSSTYLNGLEVCLLTLTEIMARARQER